MTVYPTQLHNLLWVNEAPSLARGTHAAFKQGIISVHLDQDDLLVLTGLNTNPMVTHTVGPESCAEAVTLPDGTVQFSWEPPGLVVSPRLVVLAVAFSSRASANSEDTLRLLGRFAASGSTGAAPAAPAAPAVTPPSATTPLLSAMRPPHIVAQRVGVTPQTERPIAHSTPSPEAGARETSLLEIRSATRQPPSCTTDPELALFCDASQLAGDPDDLDDESSGELVAADELGSPARFEDTSQPGDWQCPARSCGGHRNLAVLGRCDLCDHPKPARARADSPTDVTMAAFEEEEELEEELGQEEPPFHPEGIATEVRVGGLLLPLYLSRQSSTGERRAVAQSCPSRRACATTRYYRQSRLSRLAGLQASWHASPPAPFWTVRLRHFLQATAASSTAPGAQSRATWPRPPRRRCACPACPPDTP